MFVFLFKEKTAYEVRISDWSSDLCSSDLQAKLVLKQIEATQLIAAQADAGPAGPVTVGLPWTMATLLGVPLLREVRANLNSIRLEVIEGPSSMLAQLLRSEEHTSELQSFMRISYAVFSLKKPNTCASI